ncbi:transposase [Streptomyces sp. NBC_00285]|uniref:transposase n=1 Tax=Streptomyces sp. NBC_00285 TaxID=2975700 RepID=UPI003FA7212C
MASSPGTEPPCPGDQSCAEDGCPTPRTRSAAHPRTPRDPDPQPPGPAHPGLAAALRDPRRHRATLSQNVRSCGLRRTRYRGLQKTHVQHVLTTLACNLTRVADWIADATPTRRRSTRFHALCTATA